MDKEKFLRQLNEKLDVLPEAERRDAVEYYDGYISDSDSEETALRQLGTPSSVASMIIADYAAQRPAPNYGSRSRGGETEHKKSDAKTFWIVLLALFALPVGLPFLMGALAVAFSILIVFVVVPFAFGVTGLGLIIGGAAAIFTSPGMVFTGFAYVIYQIGTGLVMVGVGIILIRITVAAIQFGFYVSAKFIGKIVSRRRKYA